MAIPIVKFLSLDKVKREATFDVGGVSVVRRIPKQFEETIDQHLSALASGLAVEFTTIEEKVLETPAMKSGDVIAKEPSAEVIK